MPYSWDDAREVEPGWSSQPARRGNLFVAFAAPDAAGGGSSGLDYSVVDSSGTVRWRTSRPADCTGFAVSRAGASPIVVLTDSAVTGSDAATPPGTRAEAGKAGDTASWHTTASAYDMATGTRLWGPTLVPGTVQGPGLIFGASAPAATMGGVGPRTALDPATGKTVIDEAAHPGDTVIGEYDGTILVGRDGTLQAIDAATGDRQWRMDSPVEAPESAPPGMRAPPGAALVTGTGDDGAALIDLDKGTVLATGVSSAGYDELAHTWVWVAGTTVTGYGTHADWRRHLDFAPRISAVGSGLIYLRYGGTVEVLNTVTGRDAQAFPPTVGSGYAVPTAITTDGAGLFEAGNRILLATIRAGGGG
jgi:hypothetical protein